MSETINITCSTINETASSTPFCEEWSLSYNATSSPFSINVEDDLIATSIMLFSWIMIFALIVFIGSYFLKK